MFEKEKQKNITKKPRILGSISDVGQRRPVDEDSVLTADVSLVVNSVSQQFHLLVVADGMGGHSRGEKASEIALKSIFKTVVSRMFDDVAPTKILEEGIENANQGIFDYIDRHSEAEGMGTTAVCALVYDNEVHLANAGDSRAYVISKDEIRRVTKDHSLVQGLIDSGEITEKEAESHPRRNVITKAIGASASVDPDLMRLKISPDERLMLCCDGVMAHLSDNDIHGIVSEVDNPQVACKKIVEKTNRRGGSDNISLIILSEIDRQ